MILSLLSTADSGATHDVSLSTPRRVSFMLAGRYERLTCIRIGWWSLPSTSYSVGAFYDYNPYRRVPERPASKSAREWIIFDHRGQIAEHLGRHSQSGAITLAIEQLRVLVPAMVAHGQRQIAWFSAHLLADPACRIIGGRYGSLCNIDPVTGLRLHGVHLLACDRRGCWHLVDDVFAY